MTWQVDPRVCMRPGANGRMDIIMTSLSNVKVTKELLRSLGGGTLSEPDQAESAPPDLLSACWWVNKPPNTCQLTKPVGRLCIMLHRPLLSLYTSTISCPGVLESFYLLTSIAVCICFSWECISHSMYLSLHETFIRKRSLYGVCHVGWFQMFDNYFYIMHH